MYITIVRVGQHLPTYRACFPSWRSFLEARFSTRQLQYLWQKTFRIFMGKHDS